MQIGHLSFSSKHLQRSWALLLLSVMAGCSSYSTRLEDDQPNLDGVKSAFSDSADKAKVVASTGWQNVKAAADSVGDKLTLRPTVQIADTSDLRMAKVEPAADVAPRNGESERESYWCTNLREKALADSTILKSPVVGGSVDARGRGEMTIGLNYSNFRKARLGEERAAAECRKFMAETALQKLVFTSPQNLTAAGFRAKAEAVEGERMALARLRQNIRSSLEAGNVTHDKASALLMLMDQLQAEGQAARSQADRRFDEHRYSSKAARQLTFDLRKAQYDLDNIDSESRTANHLDVGIQAGYNHYIGDAPIWAANESQGINGKVSFSMALGVVDPRRFDHERLADEAAQRAIVNEEQSPVWQVGLLRRSHERAISGLEKSQAEIDRAISEAKRLLSVMADVPQAEFDGAKLNARFQLLKLRADRAAVVGSIIEIKQNLRRLENG